MSFARLLTASVAVASSAVVAGSVVNPSGAEGGASSAITVPDDFVAAYSDTRATGHYEVVGSALRVFTEGSTSTDKVAEYVATSTPLADTGEPALEQHNNGTGTIAPGFQLITDFDGDGTPDGILVGETAYHGDWWASNGSAAFVKAGAPSHADGSGSANHGTLEQWRAAFPQAKVLAFGFSLGSGVKGDWTIDAIDFAGTRYTFKAPVVLTGKDQCKNGGWATSTKPVYRNQGECVSAFATAR